MRAQIAKWGNSLAVRLPRQVAEAAGLREGATVDLDVVDGVVRLATAHPHYTLEELLAGITPENQHDPIEIRPFGQELL